MTIESISQIPENFQVLIAIPWAIAAAIGISVAIIFFALWFESRKTRKRLESQVEEYKEERKKLVEIDNARLQEIGQLKLLLEKANISVPEKKDTDEKLTQVGIRIRFNRESNLDPLELYSVDPIKHSPFRQYIHFVRWFNDRTNSEHYTWRLAQDQVVMLRKSTISKVELYRVKKG